MPNYDSQDMNMDWAYSKNIENHLPGARFKFVPRLNIREEKIYPPVPRKKKPVAKSSTEVELEGLMECETNEDDSKVCLEQDEDLYATSKDQR